MKLSTPPIILVVLLILVCGYVVYLQYAELVKEGQQVERVAEAERMAALLGGRLIALSESVEAQARVNDALLVAIEQDSASTLRLYEKGLQSFFPDAERISIVRPSDTEPDMSVRPPIGYACLDLARQAESGTKRPPLEVHLHGSEFAHLDIVRPIVHNDAVIASLMVSFSADYIEQWLGELVVDKGYVELQQGWEGPALGHVGDVSVKTAKPAHRAMISGSAWQLSYWGRPQAGLAQTQMVTFFSTFGATLLLALLVMYFYARYISGTVRRELEGVAEFMVKSSRGQRFHSYPVKMQEMERLLQAMEPVLHRPAPSNNKQKEPVEKGDDGEPAMMFADFGEIAVEGGEGKAPATGDRDKS